MMKKVNTSTLSMITQYPHHLYYYAIVVKTAGLCARRSLVRTGSNLFGGSKGTIGTSKPPGDLRFCMILQIANTLIHKETEVNLSPVVVSLGHFKHTDEHWS